MSCSVVDPLGCLTTVAKSAAADAFDSIARDFGRAADGVINWLWSQMSSSTAVHLGGQGFSRELAIVAAITGTVAVGLFLIQVITSTLRRDAGGLARAFKGLLVAFIAGGVAIAVTNLLLGAVDALSSGVVELTMGTNITGMGQKVLTGGVILQVGNPAGLILLSIAAIAAAIVVWFALTVRKVLIVVSGVFAPLAFAGSLADITVSWTRRWLEVMAALIASKLLLVVIFVVGWGVLDDGVGLAGDGAGQTLTQAAAGILLLGVAGFAPWMALKLVHFSGDQFHHLHALAGAATGGAQAAVAAPQKAAAWKATAASNGIGPMRSGVNDRGGIASGGGVLAQLPRTGAGSPTRDDGVPLSGARPARTGNGTSPEPGLPRPETATRPAPVPGMSGPALSSAVSPLRQHVPPPAGNPK
jgi:type IV secretion system protein TrbL